jgi:hypothetical protein
VFAVVAWRSRSVMTLTGTPGGKPRRRDTLAHLLNHEPDHGSFKAYRKVKYSMAAGAAWTAASS